MFDRATEGSCVSPCQTPVPFKPGRDWEMSPTLKVAFSGFSPATVTTQLSEMSQSAQSQYYADSATHLQILLIWPISALFHSLRQRIVHS